MKNTNTLYEAIFEAIKNMDEGDIVSLHNEYCEAINDYDSRIYDMGEFDEIMSGFEPWEIARTCHFGKDFNPCRNYFYFNGYGNLESFDYIFESRIYIEDIADYIERTENALYNDDIQAIIDEYTSDEE